MFVTFIVESEDAEKQNPPQQEATTLVMTQTWPLRAFTYSYVAWLNTCMFLLYVPVEICTCTSFFLVMKNITVTMQQTMIKANYVSRYLLVVTISILNTDFKWTYNSGNLGTGHISDTLWCTNSLYKVKRHLLYYFNNTCIQYLSMVPYQQWCILKWQPESI